MTKESLYPDNWKNVARKDWHRVDVLLADDDAEGAAFFLQQSLEKYLKAFLLEKGWKLKKIHELDTLLDYAVDFKPELENFRELCERIAGYYFTERYPTIIPSELTSEDIRKDKADAAEFVTGLFEDETPR